MEQQLVKIKFDGQAHQVDIATFTSVLLGYASVVQEAAKEVGISDPVNVSVTATEPGSLDVVISVAGSIIDNVINFLTANKDTITAAIVLTGGLYEFRQKIAGKKNVKIENKGEEQIIINADGEKIEVSNTVYNFYSTNQAAERAISSSFKALDENTAITGFEIESDGMDKVLIRHNEFSAIATPPIIENLDIKHVEQEVTLLVIKPCFIKSNTRRWEFICNGDKLSAPITDQKFLENLEQYVFHQGTTMRAILDIEQEYESRYGVFVNRNCSIVKVLDVHSDPTTEPLF